MPTGFRESAAFFFGSFIERENDMLHYKLNQVLKRERMARDSLRFFAQWGAAIHRIGDSQEFELLVPLRKPERRATLRKFLERNAVGASFVLVDVTGFDRDGPVYREISEADADELIKSDEFVRQPVTETADDSSDWLGASHGRA